MVSISFTNNKETRVIVEFRKLKLDQSIKRKKVKAGNGFIHTQTIPFYILEEFILKQPLNVRFTIKDIETKLKENHYSATINTPNVRDAMRRLISYFPSKLNCNKIYRTNNFWLSDWIQKIYVDQWFNRKTHKYYGIIVFTIGVNYG